MRSKPTHQRRTKTVGFRLTDAEYVALLPFFETFPDCPQTDAMLWLMEQPETRALIQRRIEESMAPA